MYEIKFSKYGFGQCCYCKHEATDLFLADVSFEAKSKQYILCRNCGINLRNQVNKKNNVEQEKKQAQEFQSVNCWQNTCMSKPVNENLDYSGYSNQVSYQNSSNNNKYDAHSKYQKRGGWLSFFCVTQVISCLSNLGSSAQNNGGEVGIVGIFIFVVQAILATLIISSIVKRKNRFIKILGIETLIMTILCMISMIIMIANGEKMMEACADAVYPLFYYATWFSYFEKSKRCEVYFGGKEYLLLSIFTKSYYEKHYKERIA